MIRPLGSGRWYISYILTDTIPGMSKFSGSRPVLFTITTGLQWAGWLCMSISRPANLSLMTWNIFIYDRSSFQLSRGKISREWCLVWGFKYNPLHCIVAGRLQSGMKPSVIARNKLHGLIISITIYLKYKLMEQELRSRQDFIFLIKNLFKIFV